MFGERCEEGDGRSIPKLLKKELLEVLGRLKNERVPSSSPWRFSWWLRRWLLLLPWWPKMEAAKPLMVPPTPALEREERWRERERDRDLLRSLWWCEWRLLRWDLERFECEVRAEMTEAASSRRPMVWVFLSSR
jgi:hypothetical protein